MKNYGYEYVSYSENPKKFMSQCYSEGDDWKHPSKWKKNRPKCGARCRDGHACKAKAVVDPQTDKPVNARCRLHGGLSSGPKTPEGRERAREAARQGMIEYWREKKANESCPPTPLA